MKTLQQLGAEQGGPFWCRRVSWTNRVGLCGCVEGRAYGAFFHPRTGSYYGCKPFPASSSADYLLVERPDRLSPSLETDAHRMLAARGSKQRWIIATTVSIHVAK